MSNFSTCWYLQTIVKRSITYGQQGGKQSSSRAYQQVLSLIFSQNYGDLHPDDQRTYPSAYVYARICANTRSPRLNWRQCLTVNLTFIYPNNNKSTRKSIPLATYYGVIFVLSAGDMLLPCIESSIPFTHASKLFLSGATIFSDLFKYLKTALHI